MTDQSLAAGPTALSVLSEQEAADLLGVTAGEMEPGEATPSRREYFPKGQRESSAPDYALCIGIQTFDDPSSAKHIYGRMKSLFEEMKDRASTRSTTRLFPVVDLGQDAFLYLTEFHAPDKPHAHCAGVYFLKGLTYVDVSAQKKPYGGESRIAEAAARLIASRLNELGGLSCASS